MNTNTLNKRDLIRKIASDAGVSQQVALAMFESMTSNIRETLIAGGKVSLPNIGSLSVKKRAARAGYNPASHKREVFEARNGVSFVVSKGLKEAVKN